MRIVDLKEGEYCTRDKWGYRESRGALCIGLHNGKLTYFDRGRPSSNVRCNSSAYTYNDFALCTQHAKPLKQATEKENTMKYQDITIAVITSDNTTKTFENEEQALDWIADTLDQSPRTKFTMFKPYQKIEPKRQSLAELITKIG